MASPRKIQSPSPMSSVVQSPAQSKAIWVIGAIVIILVIAVVLLARQPQTPDTQATPTPTQALQRCGNGIRDAQEECDGIDFGGKTCSSYNFDAGSLACTSCRISLDSCTRVEKSSVSISSSPSSEIFIDGTSYGMTPKTVELSIGRHDVRLENSDFETHSETVFITAGQSVNVDINLQEKRGLLVLTTYPPTALVYINQTSYGAGAQNISLPPGEYSLVARAGGYYVYGNVFRIEKGEVKEIFALLTRK